MNIYCELERFLFRQILDFILYIYDNSYKSKLVITSLWTIILQSHKFLIVFSIIFELNFNF